MATSFRRQRRESLRTRLSTWPMKITSFPLNNFAPEEFFEGAKSVSMNAPKFSNATALSQTHFKIIHAALTQPEHLILVRWMSLETQWKPSWKHGRAWKPCFKLFETRMQIFLICILIKQQKHVAINYYLITHVQFTKQTLNLNYLLLTLNVTGQLLNYPKQKSPFFFLNFKFSLNGGELVFWFTFNLAVDFRPKMALTLEILSDQMHTLTRNSAEHTLFLFFASFRRSKSALHHIAKQRVRSELTNS